MRRVSLLLLLALAGVLPLQAQQPTGDDFFALRKNFEIFASLYEALALHYVDPVDPERVMRRGIAAMLADLDPYTNFIDEYAIGQSELMQRAYGAVGVTIEARGGQLLVVPPREGTTTDGYAKGLRPGDVVQTVAGRDAADLTMQDVGALLRGAPGTTIELVVRRPGVAEPLRFVLTREGMAMRSVTFSGFAGPDTTRGIGYIRLGIFAQGAGPEMRKALERLQGRGGLEGLVLDLRGNPGGIVQEALDIMSLFVAEGTPVVTLQGRDGRVLEAFRTTRPPIAPDLPIAVLVDALSASASEIIAGALQDLDRAVVLGETTYGKGLVQTFEQLPYNTALKITSGRYTLPSGRSVQRLTYTHDGTFTEVPDSLRRAFASRAGRVVRDGGGIEADVEAARPADPALVAALEREAHFFVFANQYAAGHPDLAPDFRVDEALLAQFRAYLGSEGFSYRTEAETLLDTFQESLGEAGYSAAAAQAVTLRETVLREKEGDFERYSDSIREKLRREILARYVPTSTLARDALARDDVLARALALLRDTQAYRQLLLPQ